MSSNNSNRAPKNYWSTHQNVPQMSYQQLQDYQNHRQQAYPSAHNQFPPNTEVGKSYDIYKEHTDAANASVSYYRTEYTHVTGGPNVKIHILDQSQHSRLVYPAAEAATDTSRHAQARIDFLNHHPFAYQTMQGRQDHEQLARDATNQANQYQKR